MKRDGATGVKAGKLYLLGMTGAGLLSGISFAQPSTDVIAYTGQPVDGQSVFAAFDHTAINSDGQVMFWGWESIDTAANDECAGAIDVALGVTTVGNTYATTTSGLPWCSDAVNDVWFRFVATESASMELYGFLSVGTNHLQPDAMALYRGACGQLQGIASRCSSTQYTPITFSVTVGQTYYIRLAGRSAANARARWTATIELRSTLPGRDRAQARSRQFGVWVNTEGVNEPVVRQGATTAFDPALTYRSVHFPVLGATDDIAVLAGMRGTSTALEIGRAGLVRTGKGGVLDLIMRDAPVEEPIASRWLPPIPQLNEDGRIAYTLHDGAELRYGDAVVHAGDQAAGAAKGVTFQLIDQPVSSTSAPIVFRARLQGPGVTAANDLGLWIDPGTGVELLARTGAPAPGTNEGVTWKEVALDPAVNALGDAAFHATLTGEGVTLENGAGIWVHDGDGPILLVRAGDPAPGVPGAVFRSFMRQLRMNSAGEVVLVASLAGEGVDPANNTGVWIFGSNGGRLVVREGDAASQSAPGVVYDNFFAPVIDDRGGMHAVARLRGTGVNMRSNEALISVRGATRRMIAREGDMFVLPNAQQKVIRRAVFGDAGAGRAAVNGEGAAVYKLAFEDETEAVVVSRDACRADWDNDGILNSADFFAFLVDFFESQADFNADGTVNSQDLFDFLAAFFAGCE